MSDINLKNVLEQLEQVLQQRKTADASESYVASLHNKGLNKILEKIGEESTETILAARDVKETGDKQALISETADLWFHTLVMLSHLDLSSDDVLRELARRFDMSGLEEKAKRKT